MDAPFFEMRGITKYFARVIANHNVSFTIEHGQVLALLGENGAGKSTVMKILYGLYQADEGQILVDGKETHITTPKEAIALGISMIQQHFSLVMAHTVTENIILGHVKGIIDRRAAEERIGAMSKRYGFNIDPRAIVGRLSVGEQQKVEILKALYLDTKLLIMDEPTAVLTPAEAETLMRFVEDFTASGNSVAFITHKLKEVMAVADRIVVMRAGEVCGNMRREDTDERELSRLMIGHDLIPTEAPEPREDSGAVCLSLRNVTVGSDKGVPALDNLSLDIHCGEVLGIAGVAGNGQLELCEAILGSIQPQSGDITLDGKSLRGMSIRDRIALGIGYVPGDRHRDGLVMGMTVSENMMLKHHSDRFWSRRGLVQDRKRDDYTEQVIEDYNIKAPGARAQAGNLSGGNQQKVVVAREVAQGSRLIVFDQPTRGLDLGAIDHVHRTILKQRTDGKAVLLVSTELSEIFALSDRIAVLYKGRLQGIGLRSDMTIEQIGLMMAGYGTEKEGAST